MTKYALLYKKSILMHSEIDKEDAIRLAKLILFNYNIKIHKNE
jgi:hypothetical protein